MKWFKRFLFLVLIFVVIGVWVNYPKLNIVSGYASKNMASTLFVTGRSELSVVREDNNVPLIKLAEVSVDSMEVAATVFGLMERKSICNPGLGCVLVPDDFEGSLELPVPKRSFGASDLPFPYGGAPPKDSLFPEIDYELLNNALDSAFSRPEVQRTRTVLVAYKNRLIAERYTDGFTKDTPILGWSMTKSILATLYGILEYEGALNPNSRAPVATWQGDERNAITLDHLLRMQSGLAWEEDYSTISDVTRMLFLDADMTQAQATKEAVAPPTAVWNYSSGTSNLLSGILRQQFNTHQAYIDFPYRALIDKIGMHSMILETDMAGNYVGSSYGWASTRDWAKFGLLYLNQGFWNGERLFHEDWVDYVTEPTKFSNGTYGAHFWLNAGGKFPNVPKDLYSANGYQGQRVFIIPSKELVIVRTGLAEYPDFDFNRFLENILSAFP